MLHDTRMSRYLGAPSPDVVVKLGADLYAVNEDQVSLLRILFDDVPSGCISLVKLFLKHGGHLTEAGRDLDDLLFVSVVDKEHEFAEFLLM